MIRYQRFRAPKLDNETLVQPSLPGLREVLHTNRSNQQETLAAIELLGQKATDVAGEARTELVDLARSFTSSYVDHSSLGAGDQKPIILTGHQPELYHPGVWFKNFVVASLAKMTGGIALNLLIDSDLCRTNSVRVPVFSDDSAQLEIHPYDSSAEPLPYEERRVLDREVFRSFQDRASKSIQSLVSKPLLKTLWPEAMQVASREGSLSDALSQSRHRLEMSWGLNNLEIPFSQVCDTQSFRLFGLTLLSEAEGLHKAYNQSLSEYRQVHKLRNQAQPLPDLDQQEGWIETPFWIWSEQEPVRRALWVRTSKDRLELSNGIEPFARLDLEPSLALARLSELREQGIKIRSRALVTTLYCRLFLADLFIHGIGGAKYDQVTDELSRRFFGVTPPQHATATATLWLPRQREEEPMEGVVELNRRLRDLRYHPENSLSLDNDSERWISQKRRWINIPKTLENASERHEAIDQANLGMQPQIEFIREKILAAINQEEKRDRLAEVLDSREYSFCLFPEEDIRSRLFSLAGL